MKKLIQLLLLLFLFAAPTVAQRGEKFRTRVNEREELKNFKKQQSAERRAKNDVIRKEKKLRRPHLHLSTEASLFYNVNSADVSGDGNSANVMTSKGNLGFALGVGGRLESRHPSGAFLSGHFGWRLVPQHLETIAAGQTRVQKFDNNFLYFKLITGFKFAIAESRALDIGVGFQNCASLSNRTEDTKLTYTPYWDEASGAELKQLYSAQVSNWGQNNTIPMLLSPTLQIGFIDKKILKRGFVRIALEVSTKIIVNDDLRNNNHTDYYQFDSNRNITRSETFNDRHTAIGLNLSVGI